MKNDTHVSLFKGFSKTTGNKTLTEVLKEVETGKHAANIGKIRMLIQEGKQDEAARVKRQLPAFTLSATYRESRIAENVTRYNDVIMLDFDKMTEEEINRSRPLIEASPHTLFYFRGPSGNGLKVGVYFDDPAVQHLRRRMTERAEITYLELEEYHKTVFDLCRKHYEQAYGLKVDVSGSDIGRLCFMSYDPALYINHEKIATLPELPVFAIVPPSGAGKGSGSSRKKSMKELIREEMPGNPEIETSHIDPAMLMTFQKCINTVQRNMAYEPGQRDSYIYTLGNQLYRKLIPEDIAATLTEQRFGGSPDIDIPSIIHNAYMYVSRTDTQEEEKKKTVAVRLVEFLMKEYEVQRNLILDRVEFRPINCKPGTPFIPIRKEHYNSMFLRTQYAGIQCQPHLVRTVVNSDFARDFNPFEDYFYSLPAWDGQTDYIGQLADTLQTNNQEFWRDCLRRWIVGMLACALDDKRENQLALIIKGAQGKGKSTWIRQLLPLELGHYYRNGMLNPNNRDHMIFLSQRLIVNLDDFEGMKKEDITDLKRLITQDMVTERKAYGEDAETYVRRASFIASTNEPRFLEDITGTRRFPTVTAERINYKDPVNHTGVYSQALYLWRNGCRYWYEEEEFQALNKHNIQYMVASQEEELFYYHFSKPTSGEIARWMPVSAILSQLAIYGKLYTTTKSVRAMIKIMERDAFISRITDNNIHEYWVRQLNN